MSRKVSGSVPDGATTASLHARAATGGAVDHSRIAQCRRAGRDKTASHFHTGSVRFAHHRQRGAIVWFIDIVSFDLQETDEDDPAALNQFHEK